LDTPPKKKINLDNLCIIGAKAPDGLMAIKAEPLPGSGFRSQINVKSFYILQIETKAVLETVV